MPINVSLNSNKKRWFKCDKCSHDFDAGLNSINGGKWCPYCSGKKSCGVIDCNFCFNNSFASHEKAKFWHPTLNGDLMPINVVLNSHKKCWFKCVTSSHDFNRGSDYMIMESINSMPAKVVHVFDLRFDEFKVGRSVDADMKIADISVSRTHSFFKI